MLTYRVRVKVKFRVTVTLTYSDLAALTHMLEDERRDLRQVRGEGFTVEGGGWRVEGGGFRGDERRDLRRVCILFDCGQALFGSRDGEARNTDTEHVSMPSCLHFLFIARTNGKGTNEERGDRDIGSFQKGKITRV